MSKDKLLVKNTVLLYIRMLFSTLVGLYSSRVVINTLGVEDYGIYGLLGGFVSMMAFLNTTMSSATSRFITFELGRGDKYKLKDTFSSAMLNHIFIAVFVLLFCETIGLWYINNKMVINPERLTAANWVFQLSIISIIITITQVPYNSCIIAHEKLGVYAYVEIVNVTLRLIAILLLPAIGGDKLIIYALLILFVSFSIAMFYRIYCIRHFEESKFHFVWRPDIIKPMLSFSGWDLYGNLASVARIQGVNMIINSFFGPALNAASTIATTVSSSVNQFSNSIITSIKPQIIKSYAVGEYGEMGRLITMGCIFNFILFSLAGIPLFCEMPYILNLWLGIVPDFGISYCRLSIIATAFTGVNAVVLSGIHATGKVKTIGIVLGTLYLSVLPLTYIPYKLGYANENLPYYISIIVSAVGVCSPAFLLHKYVPSFSYHKIIRTILFKLVIPSVSICGVIFFVKPFIPEGFFRLLVVTFISTIFLCALAFFIIPKRLKMAILKQITNKFCKREQ